MIMILPSSLSAVRAGHECIGSRSGNVLDHCQVTYLAVDQHVLNGDYRADIWICDASEA